MAGTASANEPWWHLTAYPVSTDLNTSGARNEVRELKVNATGGDVSWIIRTSGGIEHAIFPFNASAGEVQRALENEIYGAGNVQVSGGPVDTASGSVFGTAEVVGNLTPHSPVVEAVGDVIGKLGVGQSVTGAHIPAGTKVVSVDAEAGTVTLSEPAEAEAEGVVLTGAASTTVEGFTLTNGSFTVGQEVIGGGLAPGTKLQAIDLAAHTATLSQAPAESETPTVISSANAPYAITFQGALAARTVGPPLEGNEGVDFKQAPRYGGIELEGTASQTERTEGHTDGEIVVTARNLGNAAATGETEAITLSDVVPAGLEVVGVTGAVNEGSINTVALECSAGEENGVAGPACSYGGQVVPYDDVVMHVLVDLKGASAGDKLQTVASVSGGGARPLSVTRPLAVGEQTPFGVDDYELSEEEAGGSPDLQAGSHPLQQTTTLILNQVFNGQDKAEPAASPKDFHAIWPAGLIGNPVPLAQCKITEFLNDEKCPPDTAIGVTRVLIEQNEGSGNIELTARLTSLFALVPGPGEPARFGFYGGGLVPTYLDPSVRSGRDYGITVNSDNISQLAGILSVEITVWGTPGAAIHNEYRGGQCLSANTILDASSIPGLGSCSPSTIENPEAFLSLPTFCDGGEVSSITGDSWTASEPDSLQPVLATSPQPKLDGCDALPFNPSIVVTPDSHETSKPTGLNVDVHVPQQETLNTKGLAVADPRSITVALPAGVAVNPSSADGLQACSEGLVGYTGLNGELNPGSQTPTFTPYLPESIAARVAVEEGTAPASENTLSPGINFCANASKIGEVTIKTPVLPTDQPIKGSVYLADQNANPFGSLFAAYIVAEDPASGILVKLAGHISLCQGAGETIDGLACEGAGQLITTFQNSPQAPFEDAELHFFGGERAPLASPAHCGAYTTTAALTPWSAESGEKPHEAQSTFEITEGPNHTACPGNPLPFSPTVTGGAENVNAGAFSPFTATFSRLPGEQNMQSIQVVLPPGLSGILTGVELCPEPQANLGECGPNSLIGETTVSVGVGGDPYTVSGGKFYLTGPYNGSGSCTVGQAGCAPFGITFEVPAKAGPFDLERNSANPAGEDPCDCVLVRGKIEINPLTTAITITSNPPGTPDAIPTSIEGIPLEIQHVNAITTRGNFQFNPTNCAKMQVTGTIDTSEGGTDTLGVPFQVTNCAFLKFTPKFSVATNAKTSKADGASLTATVSEPPGSLGTQANLTKVKVELPKDLPSRLTTLQKACTSKQFETNPAACPSESKIGYAVVHTPLIPVPLEGPAIFVSHGGEAFPSLTMVLQGYGITIDLVGTTFISKSGVTSTTFKTVPDQPFSSFTLTLPTGKYSALTALGNVCTESLKMPTEFIAQNGMEIHETTPITVTGCAKSLTRAEKLAAALKACHKKKGSKRAKCEKAARKKFGPLKKAKKASNKGRA
jgi:hypothetical protein